MPSNECNRLWVLFLLVGQSIVTDGSLPLADVVFMNYEPLVCDAGYYQDLKEHSLLVKMAFQVRDQQYMITNRNILRRNNKEGHVYYANHTDETEEFFYFLTNKNTFIQFRDQLHATTMSVKVAVGIFGHRQTKTSELMQSYKLDENCTMRECINFFYLSSKMEDEDAAFEYLVTVDLENVPVIYRKTEANFEIVPNEIDQLKIRIDAILFSANEEKQQHLIEFSNWHGALREYRVPYVQKQVETNETKFVHRMTYFNLVHCFFPLCDGCQYKGLITLKNNEDGTYHRYLFMEDRYMEVDDRIVFEDNGIKISDLNKYKQVQSILNYPTDELGAPLSLDLHRDFYVNNFVFSNVFQALISINNTLYYLVMENDGLKVSDERVPYQGLKLGFFTFVDGKFDSKTGIGYLEITNTLTEGGIVKYEYSKDFGFEKHSVSRTYYADRIRNAPSNIKFMQLVALWGYSENGNDVKLAFFSPNLVFVYRLPTKNLKVLTSTSRKDAAIDIRDNQVTNVYDFNFLRCFYSFQNAKFAGALRIPEPEDRILKHRVNWLAYSVAGGTAAFIVLAFCLSYYLLKGESSSERRERIQKKLFSYKFMKFLRSKARAKRMAPAKSAKSAQSAQPTVSRSETVDQYKTVKKIQVARPSSTKTEEASRGTIGPKTDRRSGIDYKSTPELKTIDSSAASDQRSPKYEVAPENILKYKSGNFTSTTGKMPETKNKITSLMDKMREVKRALK